MKTREAADLRTVWVRPPPIDIRFRICQACGRRMPTKGGSIRRCRGTSGSCFLCADCKPKAEAV